jgi:3-dehydroquinate synthase
MGNSTIYSKIIFTNHTEVELGLWIEKYPAGKVFLVTEETVDRIWVQKSDSFLQQKGIKKIVIPSGENNKKIDSVLKIWEFLSKNGGDRKSLVINIGGGMLTDLGGFAASTFKRGCNFLNIPTTLLSQVDASVGGKTGINFNGLKNEIGTFQEPVAVIINSNYLTTIDAENLKSGFAEMIKHGLIHNPKHLVDCKNFDLKNIDYHTLQQLISDSVNIKSWFVSNDPTEKGIRKALNFGHTVGHAFESLAMQLQTPIQHGYAVAYGMITELFLSAKKCGFPSEEMDELAHWLIELYGKFEIEESQFEALFELMTHDKKNESGRINFTLLTETGKIAIDQHCEKALIFEALNYYRNL